MMILFRLWREYCGMCSILFLRGVWYSRDDMFKALKESTKVNTPKWLEFNMESLTGKVLALPERDDIDLNIQEHLIVEFYSR